MDAKLQAELTNQVSVANKERDDLKATVANLEASIKEKDAEMVALKNQVAAIEKAKKDAAFESFLKQIKPALYNKEEDKKALRDRFDSDPVGLLTGISNMLPDASKETNEAGAGAGARTDVKNTEGIGDYNPVTRKWSGE